jgi:hypothetical protein
MEMVELANNEGFLRGGGRRRVLGGGKKNDLESRKMRMSKFGWAVNDRYSMAD